MRCGEKEVSAGLQPLQFPRARRHLCFDWHRASRERRQFQNEMTYKECAVSGWVWAQAQGPSGQEGSSADWCWTPAPSLTSQTGSFSLATLSICRMGMVDAACLPFTAAGEQQVRSAP